MDQYESSIARACLEYSGISTLYEDSVPEDFMIPSLYFPPAELSTSGSTLKSYQAKYSIYVKVFALTKREACGLAEKIVRGIIDKGCKLPVYNFDGTDSGAIIKLEPPTAFGVDEGMAQVTLSYKIIRSSIEKKYPAAGAVGIKKYYD